MVLLDFVFVEANSLLGLVTPQNLLHLIVLAALIAFWQGIDLREINAPWFFTNNGRDI